tara:strand:+ start:227 stop:811 length:585 start_codon:yes stop_codon:yes gene_type:complete
MFFLYKGGNLEEKTTQSNEESRLLRKKLKKEKFLENARKAKFFNGRRYLGRTAKGKDIWITMRFNRLTMQISLEVNGDIDDLLDPDSILAPIRITQRLGNPKPNIDDYIRLNRKNAGGSCSVRTIEYLKKLMTAVDMKSSPSHIDGKCSALLFQYVTGMVFEGDTNDSEGHFRWYDAIEQWGIPSGEYFIVDRY